MQVTGLMQRMHAAGGSGRCLELQVRLSAELRQRAAAVLIGAFFRGMHARRRQAQHIRASAKLAPAVRWKEAVSVATRQNQVCPHAETPSHCVNRQRVRVQQ